MGREKEKERERRRERGERIGEKAGKSERDGRRSGIARHAMRGEARRHRCILGLFGGGSGTRGGDASGGRG